MKESIEHILNYVCEVCDMTSAEVLSHRRIMPIPLVRGFFWYLIRRTTGYSNQHIAAITSTEDYMFTSAGVGSSITRIINAISHDRLWNARWKQAIIDLDLAKAIERDDELVISMIVPRGMKDKVKIDIKERR